MTDLTDEVRDLLAAIRDALDVPLPADPIGDELTYRRLLESRIIVVGASLRGLLRESDPDVRFDAAFIRKGIATYPATYPTTASTAPAAQAAAGESTQTCRTTRPHAHHTGCAGIGTAEHRQAAPPPGPAANLPSWVYRAERTDAPRPMSSYGTRPATAGPADRLAAEVAARVRVEHTYDGLITVWVWPERAPEHYRRPVPDHADMYLYPAGKPSEPVSCTNPTCLRREHPVSAVAAGWEDDGAGGWLCPQCAADAADRAEFLDSLPDDDTTGGTR